MKGCPLKCPWCQNPESWGLYPEIMTRDVKCISCGECAEVCPVGAIILDQKEGRRIDRTKCNSCFKCVTACPTTAITKVGAYMTVEEIMSEVEKDGIIYYRSGGGVTISGGEPLLQGPFVDKLLKACKERGVHTALDTCGYARWPLLDRVLKYVDLVLYDIKHMDPKLHKKVTGKSNVLILRNLRKIPRSIKVWLRIPLIPGYNDSDENLRKVIELGREIGAEKVSILPFNRFGEGKFKSLGRRLDFTGIEPASREKIQEIQRWIESFGLQVAIGE